MSIDKSYHPWGKILQLSGINMTIQYEMNKKINAYVIIHAMENQLQTFF